MKVPQVVEKQEVIDLTVIEDPIVVSSSSDEEEKVVPIGPDFLTIDQLEGDTSIYYRQLNPGTSKRKSSTTRTAKKSARTAFAWKRRRGSKRK